METRTLGTLGSVSALTLGGGGIGAVWGETSHDEGIATLREAVDAGITVIDAAPGYLHCESLIGEAFDGRLPDGTLLTTKCGIGNVGLGGLHDRFRASLVESLERMRVDHVDLFFLHNPITPAPPVAVEDQRTYTHWHTGWAVFVEEVVPAFEALRDEGLIRGWGITGVDVPTAIIDAMRRESRPDVIQAVTNLLDSPGGLTDEPTAARPREILAAARATGVGVMGIRAVQAGALTAGFDREPDHRDAPDFDRAAPFRALCAQWGEDPAVIAHRYALGMTGVDTVVLGVKNREELRGCLAAADAGALEPAQLQAIDTLGLR